MLLFWKKTTAKGIVASLVIAFSPELYTLYGLNPLDAPIRLNNPGIISIPLSFITLVLVSLMTKKDETTKWMYWYGHPAFYFCLVLMFFVVLPLRPVIHTVNRAKKPDLSGAVLYPDVNVWAQKENHKFR